MIVRDVFTEKSLSLGGFAKRSRDVISFGLRGTISFCQWFCCKTATVTGRTGCNRTVTRPRGRFLLVEIRNEQ